MDDLEFRRRAFADPESRDREFIDKINQSKDNRQLIDDLQQFNQQIKQAVEIPVPEGLADKIILNQALGEHRRQNNFLRYLFSPIAGVAVVLAALLALVPILLQPALPQLVFDHIYHELDHLDDQQDRNLEQVNQILMSFGGHFKQDIGKVNYLGRCNIGKYDGIHMVLAGEKGPVTIMMMSNVKLDQSQSIADQRFHGQIQPTPKGAYAIVAERDESLDTIRHLIDDNLVWHF